MKFGRLAAIAVAILALSAGWQIWLIAKAESVVGEVHLLRDRQMVSEIEIFKGPVGRLVANKWLVAGRRVELKLLELIDPNIIFFAGQPNEPVDLRDNPFVQRTISLWPRL